MNENVIREIKIKNLFNDYNYNNEKYSKIEKICEIIDNDGLNDAQKNALKKMGNSFKEFNEIKYALDINEYFRIKKFKIIKKLISFYLSDNEEINKFIDSKDKKILTIPIDIMSKLLAFITDYFYDKKSLLEIINYIPFKYFDIKNNDDETYSIKYGFPFIEEVMMDISKMIMLKYGYQTIKKFVKNKGSSIGNIFKLSVINYLTPKGLSPLNIFTNFTISEKIQIKSNANYKCKLDSNKAYLIEQENFNEKDLDYLIINMKEDEPYVYGFQISIYNDNIFTMDYLKESFSNMLSNIKNIFGVKNIKNENIFFGYIFDYSRAFDKEYINMLKICANEGWKYSFFDCEQQNFFTKGKIKINDINEIVTQIQPIKNNKFKDDLLVIKNISNNDVNKIINLVSKEKNKKIRNIKYIGEEKGISVNDNIINILLLKREIEIVFTKNDKLSFWTLDKETGEVYNPSNPTIIGLYLIYEIEN